jgi:parallel beta-helix repeat protein
MRHRYCVYSIYLVGVVAGAVACGGGSPGAVEQTGKSENAITNQGEVLGFEVPSDWSTTAGTLASSPLHTQGSASLSVSNISYAELTSVPLSTIGGATSTVAFDLMIPTNEPNPSWYGFTQLFISIPSQGVNNQFIGQVNLQTFTPGVFGTAQFSVPSFLVTTLGATYSDLTFSIVLNVSSPSAYLLDNLRFVGSGCTVPWTGMTVTSNTTLCPGTYPFTVADGQAALTIAANNVTLTCNGTTLVGSGFGSGSPPNAGIAVGANTGVTVTGCSANSFRYGLLANGSTTLSVKNSHFDANYSDATQGDDDDDVVVGGGVGLIGVTGATVSGSTFGSNWNGIELRNSASTTVSGNTAKNCTNTGALVFATNNSTLSNNNFSSAVRAATYPSNWYGVFTDDSAGILLDEGSSGNVLEGNDTTYGGDGVFIRALLAPCGSGGNQVLNNKTSYSANNSIESWCPGNTFSGNTATYSNYGLWLGGSDGAQVTNNTASNNVNDGISFQHGTDRHSVLQDNVVENNGRVGVLLSGMAYEESSTLPMPDTAEQPIPFNDSQIVLQRNTISGNAVYDFFTTYAHGETLASNCGMTKSYIEASDTLLIGPSFGSCGGANGRTAPTAKIATPSGPVQAGTVTFDASGSHASPAGGTLRYTWLAQPSGLAFSVLPTPAYAAVGSAHQGITLTPGFFDIDVTVDDGYLASPASTTVTVVPSGQLFGQAAATWTSQCSTGDPTCTATITNDPNGINGSAVEVYTTDPYGFTFSTPAVVNASKLSKLGFFFRANNTNASGWQNFDVVLETSTGPLTYTPPISILPTSPSSWVFLEVPLAGGLDQGVTWTLDASGGGTLSTVQSIQILTDTWGGNPYDVWVDELSMY